MKKFFGALLAVVLLAGCGLKVHTPYKILVTDVVMPPEEELFAPGEAVIVEARGFEADDEIRFEMRWPLAPESAIPEGTASDVQGVVTSRTDASITFLAPGHYPASKVEVQLWRRGRMMPLGIISVSDGELKEVEIYGIRRYDTGDIDIDRISHTETTRVQTLCPGQGLDCAVGTNGAGWIYGVSSGSAVGYDLTMRYYNDFGLGDYLLAGQMSDKLVGYLRFEGERLWLDSPTVHAPIAQLSWSLPEGVTPEMIVRKPFVRMREFLLLTVRLEEGSFAPLVLSLRGGTGLGETRQADAMIPLWTVIPSSDVEGEYVQIAGYAISNGDRTRIWPFDPASGTFQQLLLTTLGTVHSAVTYVPDGEMPRLCLLLDEAGERSILIYYTEHFGSGTYITGVDCSEIVAAR